jgi:ribosomal protection tetracycline resistance protein
VQKSIRNIAIMAHADAGKTTITEQFLYLSGQISEPGSVDKGNAQTDFLAVEKERGISVSSSHTSFLWKNVRINLVDTPGHVDFSADAERMMRIPDAVILVISAVEGVQAHTETLWRALYERKIPVVFFINKIDRLGADTISVLHAIENELNIKPLLLQKVDGEGDASVYIKSLWDSSHMTPELIEQVVESDEALLNKYLDGKEFAFPELNGQLTHLVRNCKHYPLLFGSAKLGLGMEDLLNCVEQYFPEAGGDSSKPFSALVYGIGHDKIMGKLAYVRVYQGAIRTREVIHNSTQGIEEKVTQVRRLLSGKHEETGSVEAGDLAAISGLRSASVGDILGEVNGQIPEAVQLRIPLMQVQVKAQDPKDYPALAEALQELSAEDPALEFEWLKEESELLIKVMGWIQMEILERILSDRFGIVARLENPSIIYKETPSSIAKGFVRYWMPKPCWAIMKFCIEPGERGSGVEYKSLLSVNDVQQKYQNEVEKSIMGALKQGIKGWEVTDIRITLIEGEDHPVHSRPGDFAIATPMGIMDGLVNTGTTLLEPLIRYKIEAPEELLGVVVGDITQMRGSFESPVLQNGRFILIGVLPLATSLDFPVKLSSRSGGKARISTHFEAYGNCTDEQGIIRPYKGISPLDTAKYILKARGAIQ